MTRRNSIFGAALLCALCVLALGAASSSATSLYVCEEVAKGTGGFTDSHCTSKGLGNYATVKSSGTARLRGTNTTPITLHFTFGNATWHMTCQGFTATGNGTNEVVEGVNEGLVREINGKFSECALLEPEIQHCTIKGGGFSVTNAQATTYMISETVTGVKISPSTGTTLTEVTLEGCKTGTLNGTYPLKGSLAGVVNSENPAHLEFTEASSKEGGLTFGGSAITVVFGSHFVVLETEKTVSVESP